MTSHLFDPLQIGNLRLANRIVIAPMCQYSARDGSAGDWHLIHLGHLALSGAGLLILEATAVSPEGRITPGDLGLYSDANEAALARVLAALRAHAPIAVAMQIAHAGRKGSTKRPWEGHGAIAPEDGGWTPVGPDSHPFAPNYPTPHALSIEEVHEVVDAFRAATVRARELGLEVVEIHAAHGYLLHEFMSPLSNTRTDAYGGSFENRIRLCLEVVNAVRSEWPDRLPLFVRISATEWAPGGWDIDEAVELARRLREHGVDLIDCSSGGNVAHQQIPIGPNYQVRFAERIRREVGIPTGAVGLITAPAQADAIVREGRADAVFLARALLRDPYWPLHAAHELGVSVPWPSQYLRAAPQK